MNGASERRVFAETSQNLDEREYGMANKPGTKLGPFRRRVMSADLTQTAKSDWLELLESLGDLRTVLYRFAPLLDSESVEIVTLSHAALKTITDEIRRVFGFQYRQNSLGQLQNWDNESGSVEPELRLNEGH